MTTQIPSPIESESREAAGQTAAPLWDRLWGAEDPSISGVQPMDGPADPETARA